MVYGPDGTEYPSWEAAVAAGVTNPSYTKPVATTVSTAAPNIPTYGYELARLMAQYGVNSPTPPKTSDQNLIDKYFEKFNAPMYAMPSGNALFNKYLDIGLGKIAAPFGPLTSFFPGQAVCGDGQRFDPVTAKCVNVTAPGGVAEANRITTGTPNVGGNQCPPGFYFNESTRSCVPTKITNIPIDNTPISQTQPQPSCPSGTVYDPVNKICIATGCPAGYEKNAAGQCVAKQVVVPCGPGFSRDPVSGVCVADPVQPCPPGQTRNPQGICVPKEQPCPPGTARNAQGNCVPIEQGCPAGQIRNAQGNCVPIEQGCPAGQERNAAGQCVPSLTDEEKAWIAKSKTFTDDQWREAMDAWIASNQNATKAQADAALLKFQVPERLYGYGYTEADLIDNPLVSAGFTPATQATQFVTPNAISGPGGADIYDMFSKNIQYAVDPRSIGGADISEQEAQQMWDIAKSQGLSVPQITEKVNVLANLNLSQGEVADIIRRLAPDEADAYFNLVGTNYDPNQRRFADGGLMQLAKKYQTGGLNTADAQRRLDEASANLRQTIQSLAQQQETKGPSKAEMYFRLASAFATPTKTGDFGESLGLAAQQMAEYRGEQREARRENEAARRDLALELAKFDVEAAGKAVEQERLASRAVSEFGRACQDRGLVPGTPDFNACVEAAQAADAARRAAASEAATAAATRSQEAADLALTREQRLAAQLPANVIKIKDDTLAELAAADASLKILQKVIQASSVAFTQSLDDRRRRIFAEVTNPDDPKVVATRTMESEVRQNLLTSLKAMFGSNPTEGERAAADAVSGLDSISVEERNNIFADLYSRMSDRKSVLEQKLEQINSGAFYQVEEPTDGQ